MKRQNNSYSVFTGDIVKSSTLTTQSLEEVRQHVFDAAKLIGGWKRGLVTGRPDFFRGDAWQLLINDPSYALRVAFFIRSYLLSKSTDSSIAIGIGPVEKIITRRISLSTGPAFVWSGHTLDSMRSGQNIAIALCSENSECARWLNVVLRLCEALISRFSERQAELVSLALHPHKPTHEQIAMKVRPHVDRQVVSKTLNRAGFQALEAAIDVFETVNWDSKA